MLAVEISSFGAPDVLRPVERPKPQAGNGEVVIRVEASGVSRADIMQRKGKYPPPAGAPDIPGLDIAGTVDSIGAGVAQWKSGDKVCAVVAGGGYAEYCAAPAVQVLPVPDGWSMVETATLPENLFTVYDNLVTRANLKSGETVLIHGGTSGIGSMGIMLCRAWGATPIATARSSKKCEACLRLGAEHAINYNEQDFVAEVKRLTGGRGVDVIADLVGGSYLARNLDALATEGRLAIIAIQGGRTAELDITKLMIKRARVIGSTMRARTPAQKGEIAGRLSQDIWPLLPKKDPIRPIIDSTYPLRDARLAHERMEEGQHIGKIVLVA
ncbi:MAG: NAD(P)H-quinone oxidoreductase [Acidobacteriaceae bacterium]|nr:NAD(P)H-quinone oxidoreductase [Acidobacteriaceae bacterium]MBV9502651.1 NAD(P)H-quinone oxidoreductase [Acidobacteriaceae bacterium]